MNEKRAKFNAAPVLAVTTAEVAGIPDGPGFAERLVEWARRRGIFGIYENTDTGWTGINVTTASIRAVNSHKAGRGKLAVLEVLPELIRDGVYLETPRRNKQQVSHVFAGKVSVDGTNYIVGFTINEDQNGKRYYNHELTEIKKLPARYGPVRWMQLAPRPTGSQQSTKRMPPFQPRSMNLLAV